MVIALPALRASPDEVKRLGDDPLVIRLRVDGAVVEIAACREDDLRLAGPFPVGLTPDAARQ